MSYLAIRRPSLSSESIGRRAWTAQDSRETGLFLAQCAGIAALAVVLYAAGPAVGLLSVAGGLALWTARRNSSCAGDEAAAQTGRANRPEQERFVATVTRQAV